MQLTTTPARITEARKKQETFFRKLHPIFALALFLIVLQSSVEISQWLPGYQTPSIDFFVFLGCFILAYFLTGFIHELGHLIMYKKHGFSVVHIAGFPFMYTKAETGWRFRREKGSIGVYDVSIPKHFDDFDKRMVLVHLGGPLATLGQILSFVLIRWLLKAFTIPDLVTTTLELSILLSIFIFILGVLDIFSTQMPFGDWAGIRVWYRGGNRTNHLMIYERIKTQSIQGNRPGDIDPDDVQNLLSTAEEPWDKIEANYIAYRKAEDEGNLTAALNYLNEALMWLENHPSERGAPWTFLEAAYFAAAILQNGDLARDWFVIAYDRYKIDKYSLPQLRESHLCRVEAAVLLALGQVESARKRAEEALNHLAYDFDLGMVEVEGEKLQKLIALLDERVDESEQAPVALREIPHHKSKTERFLRGCVTTFVFAGLFVALAMGFLVSNFGYVYRLLGDMSKDDGDIRDALEMYGKGIELDEEYAGNYARRGELLYENGAYEDALLDLDMALMLDSDNWEAYMQRGIIHYIRRDFERAIADLSSSLANDPDDDELSTIYFVRAYAYYELDDYEKAAEDFYYILENVDDLEEKEDAKLYLSEMGYLVGE